MSHGPTPAAITRTRISSGPGSGWPTSSMRSTSGPPNSCTLIPRRVLPYELGRPTGQAGSATGELQRAVAESAVPQRHHVVEVAHAEPPRGPGAGFGKLVHRAQDGARREVEQRPLGHPRVVVLRYDHVVAVPVHVAEQPADELADQVGL